MKLQKFFLFGLLLAVVSFVVPPQALAGDPTSPETCNALGALVVHCYKCDSPKAYLGKVAVLPNYRETDGTRYCLNDEEVRNTCARKFNADADYIGYYSKFTIQLTDMTEWSRQSCVEEVGRR